MIAKIQLAISFVHANLHRTVTVAEIAQSVELSPSRLSCLFKTQVGASTFQYLKRARLKRARELLETSFLSVKEIAAKVGYNDPTHLMREFKKSYGATPSQYRAEYVARAGNDRSSQIGSRIG